MKKIYTRKQLKKIHQDKKSFRGNKLDVICTAIKKLHNFINGRKPTR